MFGSRQERLIAGFTASYMVLAWFGARGSGNDEFLYYLVVMLVLVGLQFETLIFFEAALLIAMMGFVGTVTIAKYLRRGSIIE